MKINLYQILNKLCLFTDKQNILFFFYVDNIVIVYKSDREQQTKKNIRCIKKAFEVWDLDQMQFFLKI